jgi:hypothetical protein
MDANEYLLATGDWAVHFGFVGILLFTLGYMIFARWWRTAMGRNMFALALVHLITFALIVVQIDFGTSWAGRPWVRLLVFGGIAVVYWWRLYILLVDQVLAPPAGRGAPPGAVRRVCGECGK